MVEYVLYVVALFCALWLLSAMFPIIWVDGVSMYPTFTHKQLLLSTRIFVKPVAGCVYVYESPQGETVIKRLWFEREGKYYFVGDNKDHSFDSRHYGGVYRDCIISKVLFTKKKEVIN